MRFIEATSLTLHWYPSETALIVGEDEQDTTPGHA